MNHSALIARIEHDFAAAYQLNDPGHRSKHFQEVYTCGCDINQKKQLGFDSKLIVLAAWFHDLFAWSRQNHHVLSSAWVDSTDYSPIDALSLSNRQLLVRACYEHRSSGNKKFSSPFAELICSADRERPKTPEEHIARSIEYHIFHGASPNIARQMAVRHIKEKYGTGGYARFPDLYVEVYDAELDASRLAIDAF